MTEVLLFLLFVVVPVIAVLGHGIWIASAWLIRTLFDLPSGRGREDRRLCPFCQRWTLRAHDRCDWCARDLRTPLAGELSDLDALKRQLKRFEEAKVVKAAEVEDLLGRAKQYRRGLLEPTAARPGVAEAAPPRPQPAPQPVPRRPSEEIITAELVDEPVEAKPPAGVTWPGMPTDRRAAPPHVSPVAKPSTAEPPLPQLPPEPKPPAPKRPPKKSWMEILTSFLEERNIRWAELIGVLVGGLLMVGASVALVISLWEKLAAVPVLKLFIFVAYSSVVFAAGLFAYRRWKLEATGRGLLVIGTLLVPLNFLAMASLSQESWTAWNVAREAVSLAIFVGLVGLAARVLVPGARWLQVGAVVGNSALVLVVARTTGIGSDPRWFLAVGGLPVALFAAAVGGFLHRLSDRDELDPGRAGELFTLLGTAAFTLVMALGLLVARGREAAGLGVTLDRSSVLIVLAAIPVLAAGLTIVRGMSRDTSLGAYRTAGTTIALVGITAMLAALGMAWPQPLGVIAVGGFTAAALVFVALAYGLPVAHAGAIASAAVVYLIGYHVAAGNLALVPDGDPSRDMLRLAVAAENGVALLGLFAILGVAADLLGRWADRRHAEQYLGGCIAVALASLLVVTTEAFTTRGAKAPLAMTVYGIYGAGSLLLIPRFRRPLLGYYGLGLLAGATLWGLWWQMQAVTPIWAAVLALEALLTGLAGAMLHRQSGREPGAASDKAGPPSDRNKLIGAYRIPLLHAAEVLAPAALAVGVWTAFAHRAAIFHTPTPVVTAIYATAFYLLAAWVYRSAGRTWVGSMVALAGLVHTLVYNYTGALDQPLLAAVLTHATLAVAASVGLEIWIGRRTPRPADDLRRVFITPLGQTALLSSALAVPVLAIISWQQTLALAACLFWLAGIWLVIAWTNRWPAMLAASQAVLSVASVVATTAWLEGRAWVANVPQDLFDPRSLQAYGVALGLLSLAWVVARICLRGEKTAEKLLSPHGPAVDRVVRHAVVWLQLLLVGWYLLPGVAQEMLPRTVAPTGVDTAAFGVGALLVLGVMTAVMLVTLWYRWRVSMTSSLLLAATIPCLIAGHGNIIADQAVASMLRWGSALCFLACSLAVWGRQRLLTMSRRAQTNVDVGPDGPSVARTTLLAATAFPVLLLTLAAAFLQLGGVSPGGPVRGSFFETIGPELSYLVPLVVVLGCLVGFALREVSAGYAFSAGLVAKMTVVLGYLLSVTTSARAVRETDLVVVLQLLAVTAAVWAIAWLAARRWTKAWSESPGPGSARTLMNVQLGIGAAAGALVLAPALVALVFYPPQLQQWTIAAGSSLGWLALVLLADAFVYRRTQAGRTVQPTMAGLVGLAAMGLLACTIRGIAQIEPEWGYRTLMLGWGMYALFIVLVMWWVATVRTLPGAKGPPQALIRAAAVWVSISGLLAVLLGLKAALLHRQPEELLRAAAAIALASAAGAAMSVWRRREGWAFAAAPGVNLAASLVVWYYQRELAFGEWWILLVQANVIASASVALVWLAARKRLYELRELTIGTSPLLAVQTVLGAAGSVVLVALPVMRLALIPSHLPGWATQVAEPAGWIALGLAALAVAWYLRQVSPENLFHVVGGLGLAAGVLVACASGGLTLNVPSPGWLEYHVLATCWAAAGLVVLAVGFLGRNLRLAGQVDPNGQRSESAGRLAFATRIVRDWVTLIGAAAVGLCLAYCLKDPGRPWWSFRAILAASVTAGLLAIWLRLPGYVYVSGLLVNVAGTATWMALASRWTFEGFVQANVLCLGIGACAWLLIGLAYRKGVPAPELNGRPVPFAHLAVQAGLAILGIVVAIAVVRNLSAVEELPVFWQSAGERLGWLALAALAAATAISLWDRSARFGLQATYGAALLAVGMALNARALWPRAFYWTAGHELAALVLLAAVFGWLLPRMKPVWRAMRIPDAAERQSEYWFPTVQAIVAGLAVALGAWISIVFAFDEIARPGMAWLSGRTAGPVGTAALVVAAIVMAHQSRGRWRAGWQCATFALGALAIAELGWAWLDPAWIERTGASAWLHRNVILMPAAVVMTLVAGFGPVRILPSGSDWIAAGRRMMPVLAGLALVLLAVVLVHEALLFELPDGTPMALAAVAVVACALAGLTTAGVALALLPQLEPFGLSDRGRTAYVYGAEAVAGLVGVHLWLTMPWLFRLGIIEDYWMLLVMGVAAAGTGLSEVFHRRGMPVLSEPLERTAVLLPVAPAIVFWLPITPLASGFAGASPAFWFLGTLFYGFLAISRRSTLFSLVAMATANVGLCLLWHQAELDFLTHPQLWLIPVGLSLLVAEHLNYDRLTKAQSATVRYIALSLIYVSSSTEFLQHLGRSLWLPLVLISLSVLGVLAGIVLRVRSFVVLGVTFLLLVIVTMICHAAFAEKHIWIFWAFCSSLGAAIITLIAVFEKRREEILGGIARFRGWQRRRTVLNAKG